ncbi:hypothetical protein U1Q18_049700 [Sarracenia purpurea var. burkii]
MTIQLTNQIPYYHYAIVFTDEVTIIAKLGDGILPHNIYELDDVYLTCDPEPDYADALEFKWFYDQVKLELQLPHD